MGILTGFGNIIEWVFLLTMLFFSIGILMAVLYCCYNKDGVDTVELSVWRFTLTINKKEENKE